MRVMVLGSSSFLGSWAVRALSRRGLPEPALLVRPTSDLWRLAGLEASLDVRRIELEAWSDEIRNYRPDVVLSLEWAGVAGADRDDPAQWQNLHRQRSMVDAARLAGARRFIGVGSQAEYGPQSGVISEELIGEPVTEYGRAKLAARHELERAAVESGMEWVWGRVFSTYGPLDNPHWLLPGIAAQLSTGEPVPLSLGLQRWSYLYGPDAGAAFAALVAADHAHGVINIGSPSAPPLRATIEDFAQHFPGAHDLRFGAIPYSPTQVMHLQPDTSRLERFGWRERNDLDVGLATTARWLLGESIPDPFDGRRDLPRSPYVSANETAN